jgi:two-component system response regulator AtoC
MQSMQGMNVLIVDDDNNLRRSLSEYMQSEGIRCSLAENGLSAQRLLEEQSFDCMITDLKMPGASGLELLKWSQANASDLPVIMISAYGEVSEAVYALKHGADDYLVKPFDPDELLLRLRRVVDEHRLRRRVKSMPDRQDAVWLSDSPTMKPILDLAAKAAPTSSTVLITGASGTGKEVLARRIHALSRRGDGPFVAVNIGGLPENLLESELFGFEKGAFTGAEKQKQGLFETAAGGTLFLDEIGEMPLHLQVKLLRVLQDRKIQRLGSTRAFPIDVRIIAATNRNLEKMAAAGTFRNDLFYRLNVICLALPPLKDRREELPDLISHLLHQLGDKVGKKITALSPEAMDILLAYAYPGNVRELENILERALILAETDSIQAVDLSIAPAPRPPRRGTLQELEKQAILQALQRWEGRRQAAAEELGISRRTLLNKLKAYGLDDKA